MKILMKRLIEGVQYTGNDFIFDFKNDTDSDIIYLKNKSFNKKMSKTSNNQIFYSYKYGKDFHDSVVKNKFLVELKHLKLPDKYINILISKAINNFNAIHNVSSFDVIITPKSSAPLANEIAKRIRAKAGANTILCTDAFVKNSVENLQVNQEKVDKIQGPSKKAFESQLKKATATGILNMKEIKNVRWRRLVSNFLTFDSQISRKVFNAIHDGRVLIIDDIITTNTTIVEMNKQVNKLLPQEVCNFVLISAL